jgi:hypothetical protein
MTHSRRPSEEARPPSIKDFVINHVQASAAMKDEIFKGTALKKMKKRASKLCRLTLEFDA